MFRPLLRSLGLAALLAVAAAIASTVATAASSTSFSGRATVVSGTVAGQPVNIVDTGALPASGGSQHNCLLAYPSNADCQLQTVPDQTNGGLGLEVLSARTVGQGNHSHSSASTASVNIDLSRLTGIPGLPTVAASFLDAEANAVCTNGVAAASGASQLLDASVGGVAVAPTLPDITLSTPLGPVTIRFDQVSSTQNGNAAAVDVKALEIIAPLGTDLVIGFAHADITCATPGNGGGGPAVCSDKVTGGGWYDLGSRDHFALAASAGDPTWGHLVYQDKARGLKFHGRPDFAVLVPGTASGIGATAHSQQLPVSVGQGAAIVSGTNVQDFTLDGVSYAPGSARFVVAAIDNGEGNAAPGDIFGIVIVANDGSGRQLYSANAAASAGLLGSLGSTRLGGGNVQYHGCH